MDEYVIIVRFKYQTLVGKNKNKLKKTIEAMFQHIMLLRVYINVKQWNVSIMKSPYDVHFPTLIVYKRDKVYYFSSKMLSP